MARGQKIQSGTVRVLGQRELSRALKQLGKDAQKELAVVNRTVANDVARGAIARAQGQGGVAAKTAPSIRATGGVGGAGVSFGGASAPWGGGAEFGSIRYRQFKPWRGNDSGAGYFVYPTIRERSQQIEDAYVDGINGVIARRFPQ